MITLGGIKITKLISIYRVDIFSKENRRFSLPKGKKGQMKTLSREVTRSSVLKPNTLVILV